MLTVILKTLDGLAADVASHYKEKDGEFILDLDGAFSAVDRNALSESLRKEREDHGVTTGKLKLYGETTPETLAELQGNYAQLGLEHDALKASEGDQEGKIEAVVEGRLKARLGPVERERDRFQTENVELTKTNDTLVATATSGTIQAKVLTDFANKDLGTNPDAVPDVKLWAEQSFEVVDGQVVSKDGVGLTPGLTPEQVFKDFRTDGKRRHWYGSTVSADANSSKAARDSGENPFKFQDKSTTKVANMTLAGQMIRSDRDRAIRLCKQAKSEALFPSLFPETG